MTTRRTFLGRLLATLPALPFLPRLASAAQAIPPAVQRSDPGVLRQVDIRVADHPLMYELQPYRNGEKLLNAVAYDLDADTIIVIAQRERRFDGYRTLSGGVAVKWALPNTAPS